MKTLYLDCGMGAAGDIKLLNKHFLCFFSDELLTTC